MRKKVCWMGPNHLCLYKAEKHHLQLIGYSVNLLCIHPWLSIGCCCVCSFPFLYQSSNIRDWIWHVLVITALLFFFFLLLYFLLLLKAHVWWLMLEVCFTLASRIYPFKIIFFSEIGLIIHYPSLVLKDRFYFCDPVLLTITASSFSSLIG